MQEQNTMEQLVVTREAVEAYKRRTGFVGIGEFFLRKGLFVLKRVRYKRNNRGPQNQKHLPQRFKLRNPEYLPVS